MARKMCRIAARCQCMCVCLQSDPKWDSVTQAICVLLHGRQCSFTGFEYLTGSSERMSEWI
ncbi:hypothetical protein BD324DRAFT_619384 [Kockovaella imperatae]|uniref:Uncharacterized protein n=1 Tax=Kockovaella imperatae TaxID=4999 RepID=A0A1Y1UMW7_9TREE|nr:hypothetical protein BD324DRAFT_619384 [Kockovaella imperatae]ORX39359.1 hypothetical protein BD324DRAFT_619384 [Kockovaella imperatae]